MLPPGNTLKDLFTYADSKWQDMPDESEKETMKQILAEDLFGADKSQIRNADNTRFTESQILIWMRAVKRIASNEPIQYVTGKAPFYGLMFDVNPSVLIPRPETEELVDMVLNAFPGNNNIMAVDFCTGSGCIPVTLKTKRSHWHITATDISHEAINTAKKNAEKHRTDIHFFEGDLLTEQGLPKGEWNIIISNPPYVAQSEKEQMENHVLLHEPHLALFVPDNDAIKFYRRLAEIASERLVSNGKLFAELNPMFANECAELFKQKGFSVELHTDLSGKIRFLECVGKM